MEARAPWCSIAGPDVVRMLTPISFAMMLASVVFPSPGGPAIRMCSIGSLRPRAAEIRISMFALTPS